MEPAVLARAVRSGDVRATARLISLIENQEPEGIAALALLRSGEREGSTGFVVGITGYPGAGKSSVIDQLVAAYRRSGRKVAVLAVDTTSPVTGGAILGDRIRMQRHAADQNVFIRSMGTRGHAGGIAAATRDAVSALAAAGYDVIFVETVGVGQTEGEIGQVAERVVAVVAPGLGDEVQAMKAGLFEVADIVVVNKADRDGAERTARDLQESVPRVLCTNALTGEGIEGLIKALEQPRQRPKLNRWP
jgi:LAO/AO transport system kinase